jgi:hypothetical protein
MLQMTGTFVEKLFAKQLCVKVFYIVTKELNSFLKKHDMMIVYDSYIGSVIVIFPYMHIP